MAKLKPFERDAVGYLLRHLALGLLGSALFGGLILWTDFAGIRSLALALVCIGLACILVGVRLGIAPRAYLTDGISSLVAGLKDLTSQRASGTRPRPRTLGTEVRLRRA